MPMDTFTVSGSDLLFTGPAKANSRKKTASGKKRGGGGKSKARKTSSRSKSTAQKNSSKRAGKKRAQSRSSNKGSQSAAGRKPQTTGGKKRSSRSRTTGAPQQQRQPQRAQRSQRTGLFGGDDPIFGKGSPQRVGEKITGRKKRRESGYGQVWRLAGMLAFNFAGGWLKNRAFTAQSTWARALTDFALWFGAYRFFPTEGTSKFWSPQTALSGMRTGAMDIAAFSLANDLFAGAANTKLPLVAGLGRNLQRLTGGGDGLVSAGPGQARVAPGPQVAGEIRAERALALQNALNAVLGANAEMVLNPQGLFEGAGADEANALVSAFNQEFLDQTAQLALDQATGQFTVQGPLVNASVNGDYSFLFSPAEVSAEIEKELTGLEGKKADFEVALGNVFGSLNGKQAQVYEHLQYQLAQFAQALNLSRDYLAGGMEDNAADVLRQAMQMDTVLQNALSAFLAGADEAQVQAQVQAQAQVQVPQGQMPQGQMPQAQFAQAQGQFVQQVPQGQMPQGQMMPQGQYAQAQFAQGQFAQPAAPGQYAQAQAQPQGPLAQQIAQGQFVQPSGIPQVPQVQAGAAEYGGAYAAQGLPQQAGGYMGESFVLTDRSVGDIMVASPPVQELVVQTTAGPAVDAYKLLHWGANTAGHLNNTLGRQAYDQAAIDGTDVATGWALDALQRGGQPVVHGAGAPGVVGGMSAYNGNIQVNGLGGAQVGSASRQLNLLADGQVYTVGGDAASVYAAISSLMDRVAAD